MEPVDVADSAARGTTTADPTTTSSRATSLSASLDQLRVQAVELVEGDVGGVPGSPSTVKLTLEDSEHNVHELSLPVAAGAAVKSLDNKNKASSSSSSSCLVEDEEEEAQQQQQHAPTSIGVQRSIFRGASSRLHRHGIPQHGWSDATTKASSLAGVRTERDYMGNVRRIYTREAVSKHNSDGDAWLIVHGKVYDAAKWMHNHPGGVQAILKRAGGLEDATRDYEFHSSRAQKLWRSMYIGDLESAEGGPGSSCPIM